MENDIIRIGWLTIPIINNSQNPTPKYATDGSAGMDIYANNSEVIYLKPMERALIRTGLYIQLPDYCEAQIRPRSGLAFKWGITVLNAPATIDSDYRGEISVILANLGFSEFKIEKGMRIAQLVVAKYEKVNWEIVKKINEVTERGDGGFGHSGI